MNVAIARETRGGSKQSKNHSKNGINVTNFLNYRDPKNLKQKVFELLATGQGKLEITNDTVFLSIFNQFEREKFYAALQHNH
jgi:hypothetical protein